MTQPRSQKAPARKKPAPRKVDLSAVREVAAHAVLEDVRTLRIAAEVHANPDLVAELELGEQIRYRAKRRPGGPGLILVTVELEYRAEAGGDLLVEVAGELLVVYRLQEADEGQFTTGQLEQFAEVNGIYNAWPYLRELVGTMAARLGLPRIRLPLWRPPQRLPAKGEFTTMEKRVDP